MLKHTALLIVLGSALAAQQAPPVRLLNAADAKTQPTLGSVAAVRQLPNGKLLVNDIQKRQLWMFDASLASATIVADSTSGGVNSYGIRPGGLIPYLADSTLFIDPAGLSMFVLDPAGGIARVASVPRSQDAGAIGSNIGVVPGVDAKGRIVYTSRPGIRFTNMMGIGGNAAGGLPTPNEPPDTAALVRIDPVSRKLDTAGFFKIPKVKMVVNQTDKGFSMSSEVNPLPLVDDWAVLSDGSIAIVRGRDYHVDWVNPDGSMTTSPKLPFDWQRLSDEDKTAAIDSAKAALERARATAATMAGKPGMESVVGGGAPGMVAMSFRTEAGGDGGKAGARTAIEGAAAGPPVNFVSINEMTDYRPPFGQNSVRGDLDGNVWIRTSATRAGAIGGPIYDVVNRKGELVDRVQVPAGRTIVGFGKGGVVYMTARDDKGSWLERAKR